MKPNNPFLISGYYGPEYFCDREQETQTITDALYNERDITLSAPRRMGKTGLIKHVFHKLKEQQPDIITLYMDIFPTQNLNDFVKLFGYTILGQLDSVPQKAFNRVMKFIKSCRPVFTFDKLTGMPKVTIETTPATEKTTLQEIFDYLKSSEKRCYIAIDEFQQIKEYPDNSIEAMLRSYIQFLPNVNFIFSGSKQHLMQEMFLSSKKPFYQSTQMLSIAGIDKNKYYAFAAEFFANHRQELSQGIFDSIYNRFEGHTWYVQSILNRLYAYSSAIDEKLVAHAIEEIVEESTYAYENLLTAYSSGSIRLLKAIALEGCVPEVTAGNFISKHNLKAASSVNGAVKKLLNNELIYKTSNGYIVYDRFMGEWLRNQKF